MARLALAGIVCLLGACASVSTLPADPFKGYHAAIVQLAASADRSLAAEQEFAYERYIRSVRSPDVIADLQLQPDLDGSVFDMKSGDVPLFEDIQAARMQLEALHALVEQYAGFLLALSGSGDGSVAVDAETLASELRSKSESLAESLRFEPDVDDGWFFGFGVLAQEYVESQRRESLIDVLESGDDEMRAFAELGRQISMLSAAGLQAEYAASYGARTQGASGLSGKELQELTADILELNVQTLRQLRLLEQLHDAYGTLPGAHLELQRAVETGSDVSLTALLSYVESLKARYRSFSEE
jgi:hypothetical protein